MSNFPQRIPVDLKAEAARLADQEAERYFAARGTRAVPGRAREILARSGVNNPPRNDDRAE